MKRIIISFVLYLCNLSVIYAQELILSSCQLDKADTTCTSRPRYDNNGNICALIKIQAGTLAQELSFKGNVVDTILQNDTLYFVYVMNKTKRLFIYHPNYVPTTVDLSSNPDCKFGLNGGSCYLLSLKAPEVTKKSIKKGSRLISFSSERNISRLTVNGEDWKIVNNCSKRLVPYGHYRYKAVSDDNKVIYGEFDLEPSIGSKIINIDFSHY